MEKKECFEEFLGCSMHQYIYHTGGERFMVLRRCRDHYSLGSRGQKIGCGLATECEKQSCPAHHKDMCSDFCLKVEHH